MKDEKEGEVMVMVVIVAVMIVVLVNAVIAVIEDMTPAQPVYLVEEGHSILDRFHTI